MARADRTTWTPRGRFPARRTRFSASSSALALAWDGPVVRQSDGIERYRDALARLGRDGWTFPAAPAPGARRGPGPYPGTCRNGTPRPVRSIRMKADAIVSFRDRVQGEVTIDLREETGDFIVYRADRVHAYHLAAAVDDGALGVTEIVRGADLLASTGPQVHVRRALGLPEPAWAHVPVAVDASGAKLAKRSAAPPSAMRPAAEALQVALAFLGHRPPAGIDDPAGLVDWGIRSWDLARVPRVRAAALAGGPPRGAAREGAERQRLRPFSQQTSPSPRRASTRGEHEQEIGQPVEVAAAHHAHLPGPRGFDDPALGPAADRPGGMARHRGGAAPGQDELLQRGERLVERIQTAFQTVHAGVAHEGRAGDGQLPAEVEEGVLDVDQAFAHFVVEGVEEDRADTTVQLVHLAHRVHAGRVLVHPRAVAETGRAPVPGAGVDLRQAMSHGRAPFRSLPTRLR